MPQFKEGPSGQEALMSKENLTSFNVDIKGRSIRKDGIWRNQDSFVILPGGRGAAVFDGSLLFGEDASTIAANRAAEAFSNAPMDSSKDEVENLVRTTMQKINTEIYDGGGKNNQMMTTGSIALLWKDENQKEFITVGNAGDSSFYEQEEEGQLKQRTLDSNFYFLEYVIDQGFTEEEKFAFQKKLKNASGPEDLEGEQRWVFSNRNVVDQMLGTEKAVDPEIRTIPLRGDSIYILTTDGATDNFTDDKINEICISERNSSDADTLATRLVDKLTNDAYAISILGKEENKRSKPDDITAVVMVPRDLKKETEGRDEEVPGETTPTGRTSVDKDKTDKDKTDKDKTDKDKTPEVIVKF
jgi:serine/threonine protein phosphatase PrpC